MIRDDRDSHRHRTNQPRRTTMLHYVDKCRHGEGGMSAEPLREFVTDYVAEHSFDDAQCAACGTVRWEHVDHFLTALAPYVEAMLAEIARADRIESEAGR